MNDDELRRLLEDAVADVEPAERRAEILNHTQPRKVMSMSARSPLVYVAAAGAAAAVIVAAFALTGGLSGGDDAPVANTTATGSVASEPTQSAAADSKSTVPVYFVVDTERAGMRLVREFQQVDAADPLGEAVGLVTAGEAKDPDYRTLFPGGAVKSVTHADGRITVTLPDDGWSTPAPGMDQKAAELALQQIVYTAQGVVQKRDPVWFELGGKPATVFGVDTSGGVKAAGLDVLNHLSITSPEQKQVITAGVLPVKGVANSFEANVAWEIRDTGGAKVLSGSATAEGWMEERLFPFSVSVDVSQLPAGSYTFWATTDDPSDGEGIGAMTDDKQFTILANPTPTTSITQ